MITSQDIPPDAMSISFQASNGRKGNYYLWKRMEGPWGNKVEVWYWYSLGNSGREDSASEATQAAKNWITNGIRGIARSR